MSHDKDYSASGSERLLALDAALECLLWSSYDESGMPLDADHIIGDVAPESVETLRAEVDGFIAANSDDLHGLDYERIGHDFILTRNRHGAGFWDLGLGERGERLTAFAHAYGSIDAYVGDDGLVYTL